MMSDDVFFIIDMVGGNGFVFLAFLLRTACYFDSAISAVTALVITGAALTSETFLNERD